LGAGWLAMAVNSLASLIALSTCILYLCAYTPLKTRTTLATAVGAIPGALPPLIGWAAAHGSLTLEAWILFAILFFWQFPHFMAIAWMYREDYVRAGYLVLPLGERRGSFAAWQSLVPPLFLLLLSLVPAILGHAGSIYLVGALLLSSIFLYFGARLALSRSSTT